MNNQDQHSPVQHCVLKHNQVRKSTVNNNEVWHGSQGPGIAAHGSVVKCLYSVWHSL